VESGIGATLRKARNRRKIDLPEIEAATKIRLRFLRAIEDEDWDALPGDAYARAFIRTYAGYIGLDGERLVDEYKRGVSAANAEGVAPGAESPAIRRSRPPARSRPHGRITAATIVVGLAGAVVAIGLATGDGDPAVTVDGVRSGTTPPAGSGNLGLRSS
jgi:cytoskeletal protein RodZ